LEPRVYVCSLKDPTECYHKDLKDRDIYIGLIFMLTFLVLNGVVIINLVIAILATVYSSFSKNTRGLYYDTLIA